MKVMMKGGLLLACLAGSLFAQFPPPQCPPHCPTGPPPEFKAVVPETVMDLVAAGLPYEEAVRRAPNVSLLGGVRDVMFVSIEPAKKPASKLKGPSRNQSPVDFVLNGPRAEDLAGCACWDENTWCCRGSNGEPVCEPRVCWYMAPSKKPPLVVAGLQRIMDNALKIEAPQLDVQVLLANIDCPGGCGQRPIPPPQCDFWHPWLCGPV